MVNVNWYVVSGKWIYLGLLGFSLEFFHFSFLCQLKIKFLGFCRIFHQEYNFYLIFLFFVFGGAGGGISMGF